MFAKKQFRSIYRSTAGFTLIEVLVVLFIAGITLGMTGLAIGNVSANKELQQQAGRINHWLERLRQYAIVNHQTYLISFNAEQSRMEAQEYQNTGWQEARLDSNNLLISKPLRISITLSDEETEYFMLYPDSTYTAFDLKVSSQTENINIHGDGRKQPQVSEPEQST